MMPRFARILLIAKLGLIIFINFGGSLAASDFPTPINSEQDKNAEPMAPMQAAASMKVPDGFRVSVFAAEPDVQNPIAMTWDSQGRLWIAENYTYAEKGTRFDLSLRDRVVILEDTDKDGQADKRVVFTDSVQMLTGIEVGRGGLWLMCPPRVLFIPDRDGDDIPDGPAQVKVDGFTLSQQNHHNLANGIKWGPDGWLYGRCGGSTPGLIGLPGTPDQERLPLVGGIWRFSPRWNRVEVLTHGTTNPWGHDWDAKGEMFFINTVNGHLWHLIPGAHLKRPFTLDPNPRAYQLLEMHADHWHFDTGKGWQKSKDGVANEYGGGHAHTGMMIYLGDNWPDTYRGHLFTWNIHGQRANQEILERHGSGYIGRHGTDMMLARDPFFRGQDLSYGPDGTVYAIDWSDTGECHEHTGVHRTSGRVYRIAYGNKRRNRPLRQDLSELSSTELFGLHRHKNEWLVRQSRLILSSRPDSQELDQAVDSVLATISDATDVVACRVLLTLHAMHHHRSPEIMRRQLNHNSEHVRVLAIRLLTDTWPIDHALGPPQLSLEDKNSVTNRAEEMLSSLCRIAKNDKSGLVRLALASTLQRLPVAKRSQLAEQLVARSEDANDHNLPLLVWYGLIPVVDTYPHRLAEVAVNCKWPKTLNFMARSLAENIDQNSSALETVLDFATRADLPLRQAALKGMEDGLRGWRKAPAPKNWDVVARKLAMSNDRESRRIVRSLRVVFGDGRALDEVRQIVLDEEADLGIRRSALETMIKGRAAGLKQVCLKILKDSRLNVTAAKGLSLFNDREVGEKLVQSYQRFRGPERPNVISILVSRRLFAAALVNALETEKIPVADLTAYDVRQIRSLGDDELFERVTRLWGNVRETPIEKQKRILQLKKALTSDVLAKADKGHGRLLYKKTCANCHRLYGDGKNIGPDLTGSNRNNIDYLLENILDPSAVVNRDFRMSMITTEDGRVLNGLIVRQTDKSMTLQTQTELRTISKVDVRETTTTNLSPMPDGLLDNLSAREIRQLFAYLMHPSQVPLPAETSKE